MRSVVWWFATAVLQLPSTGWACDGDAADCAEEPADPAVAAHKAEWLGQAGCSWTTAVMAQRVLAEGSPWTGVGRLTRSEGALPSKVAAPFTVGAAPALHVVANEVLEKLDRDGVARERLALEGKVLEVDGTSYLVLTGFGRPGA